MPYSPRFLGKRSRLAVIWGVVCFVLFQVVLTTASETSPRLRDPMYGDKLVKLRKLREKQPRPTVVMLGSSRTGYGLNGIAAEDELNNTATVFNFGIPAGGPITQSLYLNRLLEAGISPELLLIEILPSMLARRTTPLESELFFADRVRHSELPHLTQFGYDSDKVRERYWRSSLLPVSHLRFQLMSRVIPSWLPFHLRMDAGRGGDDHGWGTTITQTISKEKRAASLAQANREYAPYLVDFTPGGDACRALESMLKVCHDRGIPVKLVLMPEGPIFRSWFPEVGYLRLLAYLESIATDNGTSLVNARDWLDEDRFYDSHHMFAQGAEEFSRRLAREAIAPSLPKERK
jgi:Protein of unknown function (DUF1574)